MIPRVQVIIPTSGDIRPETAAAVQALDYENKSVRVQTCKPISDHTNPYIRTHRNANHTRNVARRNALKSDASHFLFIDSDVAPPPNTIEGLLAMDTEAAAGWYPARWGNLITYDRWVAGRWSGINVFSNYHFPWVIKEGDPDTHPFGDLKLNLETNEYEPDPIKSDLAPLGCLMLSRDVLELLEFEDGTDQWCKIKGFDQPTIRGNCLQFGVQLYHLGVDVIMSPRIKCNHVA